MKGRTGTGLLQSGVIFATISFLPGLGNYVFQAIISRNLGNTGEFGLANSALSFAGLLGLPVAIAVFAVTHYIARFNFSGDDERLSSLLAGCRRFLFWLTIAGSLLAVVLVKPLSEFFHFARPSLMLVALICALAGLWAAFATALCQGLGWFKRLAGIGVLTMVLRVAFGGLMTIKIPTAEVVVMATGVGSLANLALLYWKSALSQSSQHPESPWSREFIQFLIVATACVGGTYCFMQGDLLVAKRYFSTTELDAYAAAGLLARALPMTVAPLLIVLFTHRSGKDNHEFAGEQLKLLGLYFIGLVGAGASLFVLREFCLNLLHRFTAEVAAMILPLIITMIFAGLLQALALWALASRWFKISMLYGALGLVYWLTLLGFGKSPALLLRLMPVAAGFAFIALLIIWLLTIRGSKTTAPA